MKVVSFLYKLLFDIDKSNDDVKAPELFHSDIYLRPEHSNFKTCPKCGIATKTNGELVKKFGFKLVNGKNILQSWCKECRNSKNNLDESKSSTQEHFDVS